MQRGQVRQSTAVSSVTSAKNSPADLPKPLPTPIRLVKQSSGRKFGRHFLLQSLVLRGPDGWRPRRDRQVESPPTSEEKSAPSARAADGALAPPCREGPAPFGGGALQAEDAASETERRKASRGRAGRIQVTRSRGLRFRGIMCVTSCPRGRP